MSALSSALLATDFSDESGWAARRAASIAAETGLRGTLVHVLPAPLPPDLHVSAASKAQQALSAVAEQLRADGASFEPKLLSGDFDGELARAASGFDLVISGARGGEVLLDFAIERASMRVVRGSQRPALVV